MVCWVGPIFRERRVESIISQFFSNFLQRYKCAPFVFLPGWVVLQNFATERFQCPNHSLPNMAHTYNSHSRFFRIDDSQMF